MPALMASGIVTRYVNYRENDRILSIFTMEQGRIDAKARGCRKPTSALLPCAQPFVFGAFELFAGKDKYVVNQCEIKESFFPIREDIGKFAAGSAMLQLVSETVQEGQPNGPLFSLLYHALSYLAYGSADSVDLLLCFLLRFLDLIGYRPAVTVCAQCGRDIRADRQLSFDPKAGGALCAACAGSTSCVSRLSLEAMRRMLLLSDEELDRVRLTDALRSELIPLLTAYTEYSIEYGARALHFLKQL